MRPKPLKVFKICVLNCLEKRVRRAPPKNAITNFNFEFILFPFFAIKFPFFLTNIFNI